MEDNAFKLTLIDPVFAIENINSNMLDKRSMSFQAVIDIFKDDNEESITILYNNNILDKIIESMNDNNLSIIGLVLDAFEAIFMYKPEVADKYFTLIPLDFLIEIDDVSVIEFFSFLVLNSPCEEFSFAEVLVGHPLFLTKINKWISTDKNIFVEMTLELIGSLSKVSNDCMDFSFVTQFVDEKFNSTVRALALNVLLNVNFNMDLIITLVGLLQNTDLTSTVFEILFDTIKTNTDCFKDMMSGILDVCIHNIEVSPACILIGNFAKFLNESQALEYVNLFFNSSKNYGEQFFALYSILEISPNILNGEQLLSLAQLYSRCNKDDVMEMLEGILSLYNEFLATPECQSILSECFGESDQLSRSVFLFIIENYDKVHPELYNAVSEYISNSDQDDFDEKTQGKINQFIANNS